VTLRSISFIATVLVAALTAFALGVIAGVRVIPTLRSARPAVGESSDLRPLAEENEQIETELQRIVAELETAKAENDRLRANESNPVREDRIGAPPPRHEIQLSVQRNLSMLKTLRDRYHRDHGHEPASIDQLVGPHSNLKRLISVDGEDYSSVSLHQGGTLTVTTAGDITVWYRDESGSDAVSKVDYPANEARFREMETAQRHVIMAATEAYRTANGGKDVREDLALLPFFATPQQAADFVELIDAMKAAGKY
jgi:hypothetical protein